MAHFSTDRLTSTAQRLPSLRLRGIAIGFLALVASLAYTAQADAGVMVSRDLAAVGDDSTSNEPASPNSGPLVADQATISFALLGTTSDTGGMGSSSQTSGSNSTGAVGLVENLPQPPAACLISRLTLFSRISLPDPFEGRFFRPPR